MIMFQKLFLTLLCTLCLVAFDQANGQVFQQYIVECHNLPNEDSGSDLSDPFLQIKDLAGKEVYRSETQDNTLSPTFSNVQFVWYSSELYNFEVRDNDSWDLDDTLGTVVIQAQSIVGQHYLSNPSGGYMVINPPPTTTTTMTTTTTTTTTASPTTEVPTVTTTKEPTTLQTKDPIGYY